MFKSEAYKTLKGKKLSVWLKNHFWHIYFNILVSPIKKSEHQRIDAFELWCWRRLLRVPWSARRLNELILKEIKPDFCWKDWCWNSNMLPTWCEEPTHKKRHWCWERLKAGGEGDDRGWDGWMSPSITDSMDMSLSKVKMIVKDREGWLTVVHGVAESHTWRRDWTTTADLPSSAPQIL